MLRHLVDIAQLGEEVLLEIVRDARFLLGQPHSAWQHSSLQGTEVVHLFFENSTRTLISFQLAAHRTGCQPITLDLKQSSAAKGESFERTIATIDAMQPTFIAVRHTLDSAITDAIKMAKHGRLINAGSGTTAHPTQAIADLITLYEEFGEDSLAGLQVGIMGDTRHSRVARSLITALNFVVQSPVRVIAPPGWDLQDSQAKPKLRYANVHSLQQGIAGCDVLVVLRTQTERHTCEAEHQETRRQQDWQLQLPYLDSLSSRGIVMHPGPALEGAEISAECLRSPRMRAQAQVANGVAGRAALLRSMARGL